MLNKLGWAVTAAVVLGIMAWASIAAINKQEVIECNRWSQWAPESHSYWQHWQIDQCNAHHIQLQ